MLHCPRHARWRTLLSRSDVPIMMLRPGGRRDIAGGIVQAAVEHTSDMIVMSTNALSGLQRAVLGSVADAVVRTAGCPVLLHRADHEG
jgi:Universal stress protein family